MFFVVKKRELEWNISLVRDDCNKKRQGLAGPYIRLEANGDYLKIDGIEVTAKIQATVYEPGVLFLTATLFRRLLKTITGQPFLTIQVTADGTLMDNIRLPMNSNNMQLYPDPGHAPMTHPSMTSPKPVPKQSPDNKPQQDDKQRWLWDSVEGRPVRRGGQSEQGLALMRAARGWVTGLAVCVLRP